MDRRMSLNSLLAFGLFIHLGGDALQCPSNWRSCDPRGVPCKASVPDPNSPNLLGSPATKAGQSHRDRKSDWEPPDQLRLGADTPSVSSQGHIIRQGLSRDTSRFQLMGNHFRSNSSFRVTSWLASQRAGRPLMGPENYRENQPA